MCFVWFRIVMSYCVALSRFVLCCYVLDCLAVWCFVALYFAGSYGVVLFCNVLD